MVAVAIGAVVTLIMFVILLFKGVCLIVAWRNMDRRARRQEMAPENCSIYMPAMEKFFADMAREKPMRFSPRDLACFTRNYATLLGSGGFGYVYRGEFPNGVPVAVKVLKDCLDKRLEEQFTAELGTIGRTYHANLVRLYGFCFDAAVKALVYEYMNKGSLDTYLFCRRGLAPVLSRRKLLEIAVGTAKGMAYLHEECEQRIIHYDIKPANILLGGAGFAPKVADFGLAKLCDRAATHVSMTGFRGTLGYTAPELFMSVTATHKCDVYSFGMLLFEMVGRRRHFVEEVPESQLQWLPRWVWKRFEEGLLEEALSRQLMGADQEGEEGTDHQKVQQAAARMAKVALWCVQYLPGDRPEMSKVVKMLEGELEIATPPNPFRHLPSSSEPEEIGVHESDEFSSETSGGDEITVCTASL